MKHPKDLFLALPVGYGAYWWDHVAPSPLIAKMFVALLLLWVLDIWTGIMAAVETGDRISLQKLTRKFGWKLTQAAGYLGIAWVIGLLLSEGMKSKATLSEPMAFVLGILIARDALSNIRNLTRAGKNIPIIDRRFRPFIESMEDLGTTHPVRGTKKKTS